MDVTKENFEEAAAQFEELLKTCKFIAFDEEMTGIRLDRTTEPEWGDTVEQRYGKMKRVAEHYMLMQVGLCLFHEEPIPEAERLPQQKEDGAGAGAVADEREGEKGKGEVGSQEGNVEGGEEGGGGGVGWAPPTTRFVARPFNFWVFPGPQSKMQVRMGADTAHFHVDNHMDFNKWIKQVWNFNLV